MLIHTRGLVKTYRMGEDEIRALDGVSVDIANGEFVAVMGPSGSGKTSPARRPTAAAITATSFRCRRSHGTLGPSLLRFGATRGNGAEMQRYVYGKIYNAKAYNLCAQIRGWAIRAPSPPSRSRTSSACCSIPSRRSTSSSTRCSAANSSSAISSAYAPADRTPRDA